ncbi:radical SAM family heme chaperone HemW [Oceanithermus sp.]
MRHLYVHVPFCPTICPYCDFHVLRRTRGSVDAYLNRLEQEAAELFKLYPEPLETLYVGGGTPSFLRDAELKRLFSLLPWQSIERAEITLEVNPGTVNQQRLETIKSLGVNRLSIGVQSFDRKTLRFLGRTHDAAASVRTVEMALELGFSVSLDLMLALPGQNVRAELETAAALGVDHVSAYTLQVEPGTPFALRKLRTDPDAEAAAFAWTRRVLGAAGLRRYEVSNYARPRAESRHNLSYWRMESWGGLGPAAAAHFLNDREGPVSHRTTNPPLPRWLDGEAPETIELGPLDYAREALMMGLRTREGVSLRHLEGRTGLGLRGPLAASAAELTAAGLLETAEDRLRPTNDGLDRLHEVILRLWEALEATYSDGPS